MPASSSVFECDIIHLPKIHNRSGNITVVENEMNLPFSVKRIYYLFDIPGGESRGGHGHVVLEQLIIAVSGSFDVSIDDGKVRRTIQLNRPNIGLHVRPGIWRDLSNFSSGAICLVLASHPYNESDYIRNYEEFISFRNST